MLSGMLLIFLNEIGNELTSEGQRRALRIQQLTPDNKGIVYGRIQAPKEDDRPPFFAMD